VTEHEDAENSVMSCIAIWHKNWNNAVGLVTRLLSAREKDYSSITGYS